MFGMCIYLDLSLIYQTNQKQPNMKNLEVNKIYQKKIDKYCSHLRIVKITKMFVFYSALDCNNVYRESIKNFTKRVIID
jgi:hypothetical protein